MSYIYFIGIDVGKESFDVAVHASAAKPKRHPNSSEGFAALLADIKNILPRSLVVLEATGGYETELVCALAKAGAAVHRAQPLKAAHYMRSLRTHGKTDALDAQGLARYGKERGDELPLFAPADETLQTLQDLQARRADLVAMRAAERQRRKHPRYAAMKDSLEAVCVMLDREIAGIEARIVSVIEADEALRRKREVLCAFKGIGDATAASLLAAMPELGQLDRRQAASLAGLAPHPKDSGKSNGYRATRGGRRQARNALFMAALSAKSANPQLKPFYDRLVANGKKPIVALTATMRKMIVILNAQIRDELFC